ncbi:thermonuclease family protein [Arthrobacter sp. TMN-37]
MVTAALVGGLTSCSDSPDAEAGNVVRVIDGDTLVIEVGGDEKTVRLLNIDTPETKHPDKPVECLGPEATEFLKELTPPGTQVGLDFDVEREDRYGRTLAAVFLTDRTLVNAEIARQGLGVPVVFEPNRKYLDEVEAALREAKTDRAGLHSAQTECSLSTQVADATEALAGATAVPVGGTAATAAAAAAGLATALATAKAVQETLALEKKSVLWLALGSAKARSLTTDLTAAINTAESELRAREDAGREFAHAEAQAAQKVKEAAEANAAAKRQQEADRIAEAERVAAAAAAAEAERIAAEVAAAAERDRIANLPPAPAPYVPAPAPAPAPANPYPGYNGPRCYAPGGLTWKPC